MIEKYINTKDNDVLIVVSTFSGTAFKLGNAVKEAIPNAYGPFSIGYLNDDLIKMFKKIVFCYWCDLSDIDKETKAMIKKIKDKDLILIGSMGAPIGSPFEKKLKANVVKFIEDSSNKLVGNFVLQGAVDPRIYPIDIHMGKNTSPKDIKEKLDFMKKLQGNPRDEDLLKLTNDIKKLKNF